ncbi:hypothetical protein [Rhodococcus opacus]|uniref:hypothetical protein n=1 Tax=Rhodococcus TaxID=1827 RepID=UPI001F0FCD07|nr:hypothetical protein [Rhodococcus opacus]MDV6247807.1 hypothetical protein [Rhodococcus opacus]
MHLRDPDYLVLARDGPRNVAEQTTGQFQPDQTLDQAQQVTLGPKGSEGVFETVDRAAEICAEECLQPSGVRDDGVRPVPAQLFGEGVRLLGEDRAPAQVALDCGQDTVGGQGLDPFDARWTGGLGEHPVEPTPTLAEQPVSEPEGV